MPKLQGKLLIVSHVLVQSYEGTHYVKGAFGRHVDAFAQKFDQVLLLTCVKHIPSALDEYHLRSQNVVLIPVPDVWHPSRLFRYARRIWGTLYAITKLPAALKKSDVVHPRLPSPIGTIGAIAVRIWRKPAFIYIAGDREDLLLLRGAWMRPFARMIQKFLELIVKDSLCFTTGPILAEKFRKASKRIYPVISAAMDADQIIQAEVALKEAEKTPIEVLFVGAVSEAKGVDVLLRSMYELQQQGRHLHLRIIGMTPDEGIWLTRYIESLGLQQAVTHYGHMAWDKVIYEYDKSDIFVLPSRAEGVPHVIVEAMSRGIPVIATSVGGIPWIIEHASNGLLVSPNSPEELTEALIHIIEDVELRKRIVLGGLEVAHRATLDGIVDEMIDKVSQRYELPLDKNGKT